MRCLFASYHRAAECVTVFFVSICAVGASAAEQVLPYEAKVIAPGAPVLSGPGADFYAVDTLAEGDVVEIHPEQPGGWLGIRPPEGSFSWLFGRHVKLLEDGLAEVDKDDVASRIGSRTSDHRNAVQVRLKKGEIVEILGEHHVDGQTWYKIAPPAGEFRWIHARYVDESNYGKAESTAAPRVVTVPIADGSAAQDTSPVTLVADSQPAQDDSWHAAPADAALAATEGETPDQQAVRGSAYPVAPSASMSPPAPPPGAVSESLTRQLTVLEMRLSRAVAEPPVTWQIEPLATEAQRLLDQARSASDRNAVQTTLTKIERFEAIGRRYRQLGTASAGARDPQTTSFGSGDPRTTGSLAPITPIGGASDLVGPDGRRYDAVGMLRPVVSKRPGAPQFALLNERGQVVSFVTPTPDVNLQPYVGRQVGVTGSRGYIPEFRRAHVTAGRVAPLGSPMLR